MEKKSEIVALPVTPFNQSKHADVCQYLDELQNFIADVNEDKVFEYILINPSITGLVLTESIILSITKGLILISIIFNLF